MYFSPYDFSWVCWSSLVGRMELLGFSFDIFLFSFVKRKIERQENYELVLQSNSQTTLLKINAFLNFIKIGNYIFIIEKSCSTIFIL